MLNAKPMKDYADLNKVLREVYSGNVFDPKAKERQERQAEIEEVYLATVSKDCVDCGDWEPHDHDDYLCRKCRARHS